MVLLLFGVVLRRRAHAELGRRAEQVLRGRGKRAEHIASLGAAVLVGTREITAQPHFSSNDTRTHITLLLAASVHGHGCVSWV